VAGLFAGIGGIEVGLGRGGHRTVFLCEKDPGAQAVLRHHFPTIPLEDDVLALDRVPTADLVAAGFPCQDLSQAGATAGIRGSQSGLVDKVLTLLETADPRWLLLENVSFMLHLHRGAAMKYLTRELGRMGFAWAYRVIDTRAFGLPQRRRRVFLLASRSRDPRPYLLNQDAGETTVAYAEGIACGFYWTEGYRGLGWAVDAVPTLKGGSTIGILSQPAIWFPDGSLGLPDIRDGERLQGFDAGWTTQGAVVGPRSRGHRWKLVGNAVSVPVAEWIGHQLGEQPADYDPGGDEPVAIGERWPEAAWGRDGQAYKANRSTWPVQREQPRLTDFLEHAATPLSTRATEGFLRRAEDGPLHFVPGFLAAVRDHLAKMRSVVKAA